MGDVRIAFLVAVMAVLTTFLFAQDSPKASNPAPDAQESSSLDTKIDTSPPKDDAKDHPNSSAAVADLTPDAASDAPPVCRSSIRGTR